MAGAEGQGQGQRKQREPPAEGGQQGGLAAADLAQQEQPPGAGERGAVEGLAGPTVTPARSFYCGAWITSGCSCMEGVAMTRFCRSVSSPYSAKS